MMKAARRAFNVNPNSDFPVDPIFREFNKFRLWAVFNKYVVGEHDSLVLERRDRTLGFSPENCYFAPRPAITETTEQEEPKKRIIAGCVFKSDSQKRREFKWGGLSKTRLYTIWRGMVRRCESVGCKDYPDYGGRGIVVCDEWHDFLRFYDWAMEHGYDEELSIDRMDVNGNYCPENCRWASNLEQMLNTRAYEKKYTNVRLHVEEMRRVLSQMPDNAVVTLIARTEILPEIGIQAQSY